MREFESELRCTWGRAQILDDHFHHIDEVGQANFIIVPFVILRGFGCLPAAGFTVVCQGLITTIGSEIMSCDSELPAI